MGEFRWLEVLIWALDSSIEMRQDATISYRKKSRRLPVEGNNNGLTKARPHDEPHRL